MKANRAFKREDRGVSTAIGAILLASLMAAGIIMIRLVYVPVWQKDSEVETARIAERQMIQLQSEARIQTENGTSTGVTIPVSASQDAGSILLPRGLPSQVDFRAGAKPVTVSSSKLLVQQSGGANVGGASEVWIPIGGGKSVNDVATMIELRLRIARISASNDQDAITFTVKDKGGAFAGDFRLYVTDYPSGYNINVRVRNATSDTQFDQGTAYFQQNPREPFWVDLLQKDFRFDRVIAAAQGPLNFTLVHANVNIGGGNEDLAGDYSTTYAQSVNGVSFIVGSGKLTPNYVASYSGGTLSYFSNSQQYVPQRYILENGALIVSQGDGAAFKVSPPFRAELAGNRTVVSFVVPALSGSSASVSGSGSSAVTLEAQRGSSFSASATDFTYAVTTDFPALYVAFWKEKMESLGLVNGTQFVSTRAGTTATLSLTGSSTNPNYYDMNILFKQADVKVSLQG